MSTEVALISIWQDGHRWWREDQVLAMMESVGVKSYQQAREDAALSAKKAAEEYCDCFSECDCHPASAAHAVYAAARGEGEQK